MLSKRHSVTGARKRRAPLQIKILISGCMFDRSDAGAQGVQPDSPRQSRIFGYFLDETRKYLACRGETRPLTSNKQQQLSKKQKGPSPNLSPKGRGANTKAPIPTFPQWGKEWNTTLTPALSRKRARE